MRELRLSKRFVEDTDLFEQLIAIVKFESSFDVSIEALKLLIQLNQILILEVTIQE